MGYADRMRAGIDLLDKNVARWTAYIDVDRLDMRSCLECVLGQLFGNFNQGTSDLLIGGWASEYGFDLADEDEYGSGWRSLNRLWVFVVRKRQKAGVS
jgi:hypothetical protein